MGSFLAEATAIITTAAVSMMRRRSSRTAASTILAFTPQIVRLKESRCRLGHLEYFQDYVQRRVQNRIVGS